MHPRWILSIAVLGACGDSGDPVIPGCVDPPRGPALGRFGDVTAASGIVFQYRAADFTGGGLAVADLDGDGLPEIVAGRQLGGLMMFRNRGSLRFEPSVDSGLDVTLAVSAIAAVDLDNDGDLDLVLAGPGVAYVMANQGDGTFREAARFDGSGTTQHILPVDLDGDGLLDLYFSNHDLVTPESSQNRLYLNRGGLQFTSGGTAGAGQSWSATAFDVDGDGDQDIYVANDTLLADFGTPPVATGDVGPVDLLLRNDGPGTDGVPILTDIAAEMGLAQPRSSMGGLLGDFNDDGQLDLYVPNLGAKKLFLRDPAAGFADGAVALGVAAMARLIPACASPSTESCLVLTWSAVVSDFDLDGYDELMLVNGLAVTPSDPPPVIMFTRGSALPYHEVSPEIACMDARGVVATDLDGDGDQDIVIAEQDGPLVVYENRGRPTPATWLRVTLRGSASNASGVGAVVTLHLASGRIQTRVVGAGGVLNSSSPAEALFGLGNDQAVAVDVQWPSGHRSELTRPSPGVTVIVDEVP